TPTGLVINANTGAINVGASTPGTYAATYFVPANACTGETSHTIEIETIEPTAPVVDFSYSEVCINALNNPQPIFASGFATGGIFSSGSLDVNPNSGEVNLDSAIVGTHTITYTVEP